MSPTTTYHDITRHKWHSTCELCVFVVWALIFLCCLRRCLRNAYAATVGAYAAHPFEGVPTQAQRPCKATPQCTLLPTPSYFRLLLEGWKRNFCLRDHSPIHIFARWGALRHPALPAAARAPRLQGAHRHLAATPMCSSRASNQVPKRTLNIWWINHDKSLKAQLVTFDYAGVKPSDVFDWGSSGRFNVSNKDWCGRGLVVSPGTRAYAVPTRSLREAYACSRGLLAGIWWNIPLKQELIWPI